jgi:ubiquinone biosynthesis protein COQ9
MGLLVHPANVPRSLRMLHELIDEIWHQAGDTSITVFFHTDASY